MLQVTQVERLALTLIASSDDPEAVDLVDRLRDEFDSALTADLTPAAPAAAAGDPSPAATLLTDLGVA